MREKIGTAIRPRCGRKIEGISAVFMPFDAKGNPDFGEFGRHLARTVASGLCPAVNMDTGFGPQLSETERETVLKLAREALGERGRFVAGAQPGPVAGEELKGYRTAAERIRQLGGDPIVFPSEFLSSCPEEKIPGLYEEISAGIPGTLVFELGKQFAPYGRIFEIETFERILDLRNIAGLKHSSLDRAREFRRLAVRDAVRADFRIYTGNDLGIDMIMYGSDYLLGLSTFDPEAFALRDRLWEKEDPAFFPLNDALQALGFAAFREPVPAYRASAAVYLKLAGKMKDPQPHPACPRRPAWEPEILRPLAREIARAKEAAASV